MMLYCAFCLKSDKVSGPLITGDIANICWPCTDLCVAIVESERAVTAAPPAPIGRAGQSGDTFPTHPQALSTATPGASVRLYGVTPLGGKPATEAGRQAPPAPEFEPSDLPSSRLTKLPFAIKAILAGLRKPEPARASA